MEEDGYGAEGLGSVDEGLLNVSGFGGAGDETAETEVGHFDAGVGFVHIAYYVFFVEKDDKVFADEDFSSLLHGLGNPDTGVFSTSY